jgi:hypothetical protein
MKAKLGFAILLSLGTPVFSHRLDEYLQATIISVEKDRVDVFMRLIPGVAVSSSVLANIHGSGDRAITEKEQRAYAEQVLKDVYLAVDGNRLNPQLVSVNFPTTETMKEGTGEIQLESTAHVPQSRTGKRALLWENHHQRKISVYLVNSLVPQDRDLQIVAQRRNKNQSFYELDYSQAGVHPAVSSAEQLRGRRGWLTASMLILFVGLTALCGKPILRIVSASFRAI